MKEALAISIVSGDEDLIKDIYDLIKVSVDRVRITSYKSEISFLETFDKNKADLIISDRTHSISDWRSFLESIQNFNSDSLVIFIVEADKQSLAVEMISAKAYDILSPGSFYRIPALLSKCIRDIEDKTMLKYLSKEKYFSDHITNYSRSMLSIVNRDYIYEKVNNTFCNAHNTDIKNVVGKSLSDVWGKDTFKNKIKNNIDICFSGSTIRYEASFDTPAFGLRYFEVVFRPIIMENGEVPHLLAETFDMTDLRLSKQAVNEMEEEFKKIETNLPIGFLRCNLDGTIQHANKAFLKIMECEDNALLAGLNINEFYVEKDLYMIHFKELQINNIITFGRVALYTYKGNETACRISGFIVAKESGNPSVIDFAFEDSSRELLLENRLLQAQKLETIGDRAVGIAHDFNNILTTIFGYSELLLDEIPKETPSAEKIKKIIMAVSKARSLTNQILTFNRQVEQDKIFVSVSEVLKETMGFVKSTIPDNIKVIEDIKETESQVYADPAQLSRVILNLTTNAIQAMENTGGSLSVNMVVIEGRLVEHTLNKVIVADEYVLITIEDTGEGIEPSLIQRIFEPYFTTKKVGNGTGLGLSVVQGIVSEIEGEIIVSSRKDKGSVFSVFLPVSNEYPLVSEKTYENKKILFVTGNRYESGILSQALRNSGFKLIFASDRNHLIKIFSDENGRPDAIIYMGDSEEITADDLIILFSKEKINPPIILITDENQFLSKEKLVYSGIVKYHLSKPVLLKEIRNAIQMSLT
jgi:signal transduction histidine kinase